MKNKKSILLIEDDQIDIMTVKRALSEIRVTNRLDTAWNGEEGLKYLRDPEKELPGIILLDLNMPKMNGLQFLKKYRSDYPEFLKIVKNEKELKRIPVVVLTTSKEDRDKVESFDLGVAGYMIKPVDYKKFVDVIKAIHLYWTLSEIPGE